ncbi:MAG: dihydrofolate reductase [bacterium]|nr:dihydrofolate reductase [bacterium]
MKVNIIAAMDEKRGIGKNNDLLFRIPEDFKRMKALTIGHPIIMGRKTFESIGRPLPNRTNIIITRDTSYKKEGTIVVHSLEDAIEKARNVILSEAKDLDSSPAKRGQNDKREKEIFIFGGGQIFAEALPLVDKLYLTIVEGDFNADTFFPDYSEFKNIVFEQKGESGDYKYKFLELEK